MEGLSSTGPTLSSFRYFACQGGAVSSDSLTERITLQLNGWRWVDGCRPQREKNTQNGGSHFLEESIKKEEAGAGDSGVLVA